MVVQKPSNSYGIAGLILGIISIVFCWVPILGIVCGILGIILYVKQKRIFLNGMATAGLVTSIIGLVFSAMYSLLWLFILIVVGSAM